MRLGGAGRLSHQNTWHPWTGEAAKTRWVWSLVVGGRGYGAGAEAMGKREWSASLCHEAGASRDNKGSRPGAGRGAWGEPRDGGGVG